MHIGPSELYFSHVLHPDSHSRRGVEFVPGYPLGRTTTLCYIESSNDVVIDIVIGFTKLH